jgi:hypothetical protein
MHSFIVIQAYEKIYNSKGSAGLCPNKSTGGGGGGKRTEKLRFIIAFFSKEDKLY